MKPRILFVDDDPVVLESLRQAMHPHEDTWSVSFAQSVTEALDLLQGVGADTIVTDVIMPGMSGFDLLERLQSADETKDIPVVVLTGCDDSALKSRALDLGAADLLAKPVNCHELVARLRSSLRLKAYQDQIRTCNATLHEKIAQTTRDLATSQFDMIWRLARAAEFHDEDAANHVIRVGFYCRTIAEAMGMDRDFVERIFLASPLHDIGKVAIPSRILRKPGQLNPDERAIMQQHCATGAEILRQNFKTSKPSSSLTKTSRDLAAARTHDPLLHTAASIALTHHERWDGNGYIQRLKGESIPLESRIVAIADTYDALRSFRPHRPAHSHEQALELMGNEQGSHFDPQVYAAFLKVSDALQSIRTDLAYADVLSIGEVCRP